MTTLFTIFIGCWLSLAAASAYALNCSKAITRVDLSICHSPDLSRQDASLNDLYIEVRRKLTVKARRALLNEQRRWLVERVRSCATADLDCLRAQYGKRIDQLSALNATSDIGAESLDNIITVMVTGSWKITSIKDPVGGGEVDVVDSLKKSDLPMLGDVVSIFPGKWCFPGQGCTQIGWMVERLNKLLESDFITHELHLSSQSKVLTGSSGSKDSSYVFTPRPDGTLWASFGLCGSNSTNCRNAFEVWTPASSDTAILVGSQMFVPAR